MDSEIKKYIVGSNQIPDWIQEYTSSGRIRFNYDNDKLINVSVSIQSKVVVANIDDVILKSNSGLVILPKNKAKKYILNSKQKVNIKIKDSNKKDNCK